MSGSVQRFELPPANELKAWVERALDAARRAGASAAEANVSVNRGLSVTVRGGDVEALEFHHDRELSITVYFGLRSGSADTTDLTPAGLSHAVEAACTIAKAGNEDPCSGLADAARMATRFPDLELDHPWALDPDRAIELACEAEAAALAVDERVTQTEGAMLHSSRSVEWYGNTHGFLGEYRDTDHSLSCSAIATEDGAMQRDDWYTTARDSDALESPAEVGRRAGERAVARLGAKSLSTRTAPVLFTPEVARGLFGHFLGAISGGALYRKSSFLLDRLGDRVFAPQVQAAQRPFLPRAAASAAFDREGVATADRTLVADGVLEGWLLGSYAARKLELESTGNAGGVFNFVVEPGQQDFNELVRGMGTGLVVTELMGQGVNPVTGDYSRGAGGWWVEGGERRHAVQEVTIAGNLLEMYRGIREIGCDVDTRSVVRTGSVLVDRMTIAGN